MIREEGIKEEGHPLFDSRFASLGHTLQGGTPSPLDRARAVRLSLKCMAFIEKYAWEYYDQPERFRKFNNESAAVITIEGSLLHFSKVTEVLEHADMKNRRGISTWWEGYKDLAEVMGSKNYFAAHL